MVSDLRKQIALGIILATVSGCGATHTAITKRNLEVKTRMSDTIFLSPVPPKEQVVFVRIRNTSGLTSLNIEPEVKRAIQAQGYKITNNPDKAYFLLQANVIQAGRIDDSRDLMGSYGEALSTGLLGAAIGGMTNSNDGAIAGAAAGAAVGFIANTLVQDVTYSIITDIQVSERAKEKIKQTTNTTLAQGNVDQEITDIKLKTKKDTLSGTVSSSKPGGSGSSTVTKQEFVETTPWKQYRTRVVSYANKMNLAFEEAQPKLVENLANALAGVF